MTKTKKIFDSDSDSDSDYQKALAIVKDIPKFYLGQEVQTKDGNGIIVKLHMKWNGLYIQPNSSEAVVWFSTKSTHKNKNKWISFTYNLLEIKEIPK